MYCISYNKGDALREEVKHPGESDRQNTLKKSYIYDSLTYTTKLTSFPGTTITFLIF